MRRKLLLGAAAALLAVATIELCSLVAFWAVTGDLWGVGTLRSERRQIASSDDVERFVALGERPALKVELHPFFGFGDPPGFEFLEEPQAPPQSDPDALVVGLTGGSVAWGIRNQPILTEAIGRLPQFSGRNVYLVMLGSYAWKQPQQLTALSYYLALGGRLDVLINLDGRNEISDAMRNAANDVFPAYPWLWPALASNTVEPVELKAIGVLASRRDIRRRFALMVERFSVGITPNVGWFLIDRAMARSIDRAVERLHEVRVLEEQERDRVKLGPRMTLRDRASQLNHLAAIWRNSSLEMDRLMKARGSRYFQFLQPNQYVPESKVFTSEERSKALRAAGDRNIVEGYPVLQAASTDLIAEGVEFFDLTMMFQGVNATVYRDQCCHFNELGSRLLAERIAGIVARRLGAETER